MSQRIVLQTTLEIVTMNLLSIRWSSEDSTEENVMKQFKKKSIMYTLALMLVISTSSTAGVAATVEPLDQSCTQSKAFTNTLAGGIYRVTAKNCSYYKQTLAVKYADGKRSSCQLAASKGYVSWASYYRKAVKVVVC